jgi:hypothetical protein
MNLVDVLKKLYKNRTMKPVEIVTGRERGG